MVLMTNRLIMRKLLFLMMSCFILVSCGSNTSQETSYNNRETIYFSPPENNSHQDVEIIDEGTVMIEDFVEEDNWTEEQAAHSEITTDFVGYTAYTSIAQNRLYELANSSFYQKRSGKLKRLKIAKQLNKEGYRKNNGKKFRIKDIPKRR